MRAAKVYQAPVAKAIYTSTQAFMASQISAQPPMTGVTLLLKSLSPAQFCHGIKPLQSPKNLGYYLNLKSTLFDYVFFFAG